MKNFAINFLIYYVILSVMVGILTLLTGIHGNPMVRVLTASFWAYVQPLYNKK